MARPPKYEEWLTEEGLILIQGWARDGLVDEQIAHNMGISTTTLYEWKNKFPELAQAIKKGLSEEGGLFVPSEFPELSKSEIAKLAELPYKDRAAEILSKYLTDFTRLLCSP